MSSPVKLKTNTSPSTSVWEVQAALGQIIGVLLSLGVFFLDFTSLGAARSFLDARFAPHFRILYDLFSTWKCLRHISDY